MTTIISFIGKAIKGKELGIRDVSQFLQSRAFDNMDSDMSIAYLKFIYSHADPKLKGFFLKVYRPELFKGIEKPLGIDILAKETKAYA